MQSDIVSVLDLNSHSIHPNLLVAIKDSQSDLNFIFSEILSYYIKNDYSVVIVNIAQSCNHYNHVLLKSGINMRKLRDQQKISTVDFLSEVEKLTLCDGSPDSSMSVMFSDSIGPDCLKDLYLHVKKSVDSISTNQSRPYVLFIDEISILLSLGIPLNSVEPFLQYCKSLSLKSSANPNVLFLGALKDPNDIENTKLVNYLLHLSNIRIEVECLKTGYSKDADGKITLCVQREGCRSHPQKLLFKISDRGAKLLTLGL